MRSFLIFIDGTLVASTTSREAHEAALRLFSGPLFNLGEFIARGRTIEY